DKLPDILSSTEIIGNILPETAKILGLKENVKVVCGGVDNSCMALGTGCVKDGMAYTSIGSSAWIAVSSHEPVLDFKYKPYVFAHCIPDMFVSSTSIFSAGTSFSWVKDTICKNLINEKEPYKIMDEMASKSEVGSKKLIFNPSLAGGSSIEKSPNIKGGFIGLNLGHTQNDLIRASMEGICLNLKMALEIMEQYVFISEDMLIAGGGSKSSFWRRLFADIYNKNILETSIGQNAAALGAAALGAVGMMIWPDFNKVNEVLTIKSITKPERENEKKYKIILGLFKKVAELQSDIGNIIEEITW
ncbi:MAG: FGGY-family carbohydrate kinase, partial [Actinomycetota bacterium]